MLNPMIRSSHGNILKSPAVLFQKEALPRTRNLIRDG